MGDRLQPILDNKRATIAARKAVRPVETLDVNAHGAPRGFAAGCRNFAATANHVTASTNPRARLRSIPCANPI